MANKNTATYFVSTAEQRDDEYPDTPFQNAGMNLGGSNAPGIGINSGDINPKASDWPRIDAGAAGTDTLQVSQQIGGAQSAINGILAADKAVFAFVQAPAEVAIDAQITTAEGFALFNRSDKVLPDEGWMWGQGVDTG